MRVTISNAATGETLFSLIDGSWLNSWPIKGEVFGLEKEGLEGWFGSVDPRVEEMPAIPNGAGSFWPEQVYLSSRVLTIRGFHSTRAAGTSTLSVSKFRDLLASMVGIALSMQVEETAGTREVTGYLVSRAPLTMVTQKVTKFTLIIECPDPLKYGLPVSYEGPGTVSVENVGTGEVAPVVSVDSFVESVRVEFEGNVFEWAGAAQGLHIDLAEGIPRDQNGTETGVLVWADPIRVPQGQHDLTVISDAQVRLTIRPGWK